MCLFIKINAAVASSRFYYAIFTQSLFRTTSSSLSSPPSSLSHVSMCVFHRKNLRIIFQFIMVTLLLPPHFPLHSSMCSLKEFFDEKLFVRLRSSEKFSQHFMKKFKARRTWCCRQWRLIHIIR